MTQRDYILRVAEEFGRALAQVLYNRQIQDYAAAHKLIDEQSQQAFGMGIGFMRSVPEDTLLSMFTSFETLDTEKCWLLALLLKADGDVYLDQENVGESYYSYIRSLNLVLEVLLLETSRSDMGHIPELEDLLSRLSEYELPTKTSLLLFQYFDHTHQYAKAEDVFLDMIEADDSDEEILEYGISFYQRLKRKTNTELSESNFSREKAEQGLERLERMGS